MQWWRKRRRKRFPFFRGKAKPGGDAGLLLYLGRPRANGSNPLLNKEKVAEDNVPAQP
jgi:hypothetical protein